MQLYLNEKIESIPVFKTLIELLNKFESSDIPFSSKYYKLEDIYATMHLKDPVRDYVEYHLMGEGDVDEGRLDYIVNALYAAKGSPLVFDVIKETLSQNIYYKYVFPVLDIIRLEVLRTDNVTTSINKMKDMLYYLLYYVKATIYLNNIILQLKGNKDLYITATSFGYNDYSMSEVTFDLSGGDSI